MSTKSSNPRQLYMIVDNITSLTQSVEVQMKVLLKSSSPLYKIVQQSLCLNLFFILSKIYHLINGKLWCKRFYMVTISSGNHLFLTSGLFKHQKLIVHISTCRPFCFEMFTVTLASKQICKKAFNSVQFNHAMQSYLLLFQYLIS